MVRALTNSGYSADLSPEERKKLHLRVSELESELTSLSQELLLSRTANKFLTAVLDTVDALVVVVDYEGRINRANQAFLGLADDSDWQLNKNLFWDVFLLPDGIAAVIAIFSELRSRPGRTISENFWLSKDGNLRLISWSFTVLRDGSGQANYVVGVGQDITEREQTEEDLRINKERYRLLFDSVNDSVFVYSLAKNPKRSKLIEINQIACQRLGYSREELLNRSPFEIERPEKPTQLQMLARKLRSQNHALYEAVQVTKAGQRIPVEVNAHLFSLYGETAVLSVARDITERRVLEEKLRFVTMHDSLTGLYNRAYFDEEIGRLEHARDLRVGVFICDVDGLKIVNDSRGHQAGDAILKEAAQTISQALREGDFVARIGGDEFAVILYNVSMSDMELVKNRICANIAGQNKANPGLPLSLSLGYALAAGSSQTIHRLIKEADDHMYCEKMQRRQRPNSNSLVLSGRMS
jgi:diguanylate cyclase (GGDEF)-like protein/PAS domain S-box-containing protein